MPVDLSIQCLILLCLQFDFLSGILCTYVFRFLVRILNELRNKKRVLRTFSSFITIFISVFTSNSAASGLLFKSKLHVN